MRHNKTKSRADTFLLLVRFQPGDNHLEQWNELWQSTKGGIIRWNQELVFNFGHDCSGLQ